MTEDLPTPFAEIVPPATDLPVPADVSAETSVPAETLVPAETFVPAPEAPAPPPAPVSLERHFSANNGVLFLRLFGSFLLLLLGAAVFWLGYRGQQWVDTERFRWFLVVGPVVGLIGINALWENFQWWGAHVKLDGEGLEYSLIGRRYRYPWQAIKHIWQQGEQGGTSASFRYMLEAQDGKRFYLSPTLHQNQRLGRIMQDRILRHKYPLAVADLQDGKTLDFHAFQLSKQQIQYKRQSYPLSDVARIELKSGKLSLWERGSTKAAQSVGIGEVSNIFLLLSLLRGVLPDENIWIGDKNATEFFTLSGIL